MRVTYLKLKLYHLFGPLNIGKRLLFLSDSLPLTLSACKGRGRSSFLLRPLRKICALSLACDSRIHVRWIPSEWNCADGPSRALSQWAARGLSRWFTDGDVKRDRRRRGGVGPSHLSRAQFPDIGHKQTKPDFGEEAQKKKVCSRQHDRAYGNDISGSKECQTTHYGRLHQEVPRVQGLGRSSSTPTHETRGSGPSSSGVLTGVVRPREGCQRWGEGGGCLQVLPATHCKGARNQSSQGESRFEGLEFGRTTSAKDAHASGGDGSSSWNLNERVQDQHGYPDVLPIHHLSEARGMQLFDSQAVSPTARDGHPALQSLGHSPPSIGGSDSGENQHFRCVGDSGFRPMARRLSQKHDAREEAVRRLVDRLPCRISKSLQPRTANPEARQSGNDVVCHQARRSNSRCAVKEEVFLGGETTWKVGQRQLTQAVRQRGKTADRGRQGPRAHSPLWPACPSAALRSSDSGAQSSKTPCWNFTVTKGMKATRFKKPIGPKTLSGADLLRRTFKDLMRIHKPSYRGIFLDLFSGKGGITHYLSKFGCPVISVDVCVDARFDLLNIDVCNVIFGWIKSGCVLGIWLATPSTTWSLARHGPVGTSWGPLRSNQHLFGVPGLSPTDQAKVRLGNSTFRFTFNTIKLAIRFKIPCFLENPAQSMMWKVPRLRKLCDVPCSRLFVCDFCQFGSRWRKRTHIQSWYSQDCNDHSQLYMQWPWGEMQCHRQISHCPERTRSYQQATLDPFGSALSTKICCYVRQALKA